MGHSFGPESEQYEAAIFRVDDYLSRIFQALPEKTIIAIFADHGMHSEGLSGNHNDLIYDDLIIPIMFIIK
jgi:predicted AlkP superfamily pyrophosphatase or phosphodiesterase